MKALIFGDGDSIWTKSLIENTMISFHDEVTLLTTTKVKKYHEYYIHNNVKVFPYKKLPGKIGTLVSGITNRDIFTESYDVFCCCYITRKLYSIFPFVKKCCAKIILVFWGSDILRTKRMSIFRRMIFRFSDYIMLSTKEMIDKFHEQYGNSFDNLIVKLNFGANTLNSLSSIISNSKDIKEKYSINNDKVVISIGSNRMYAQQHLKVLDVILSLPLELRRKIHLSFLLTYGTGNEKYINQIRAKVIETGCTSSIYEDFLPELQVAEIISITDIYINAQTTDARSAFMLEHLYAHCLVMNPSWIKYSELEGILFYLKYSTFDELRNLIMSNTVPKNECRYSCELQKNEKVVYELFSWDSCVPGWRELFLR